MRSGVSTVSARRGVNECVSKMQRRNVDTLIVVDDQDRYQGTVSIADIRLTGHVVKLSLIHIWLDRAVHGQQQHPLLLLVDGVDGKAAVRIVIAGRPVDGGVDKVPAEEARVVSAPLPQRLNGRV